ncbi:MAG: peptidase S8 [Leptothrix sp. (in: Bacteria)]|nr:peptidase S8 [Leptothrix sp. (in: b-proteobacteria)]
MSLRVRSLLLALVAASVCTPNVWAGGMAEAAAAAPPTDRLIVQYRGGSAGATRADRNVMAMAHAAANQRGVQFNVLRRNAFGALVLKLDRRVDEAEAGALARALAAADADIEYAEPDRILRIQLTPNDARYLDQWHYYEATAGLNLPAAWDKTTGTGVRVAVIDTGYRPHADLAANLVGGYDFIGDTFVANDGSGRDSDASDPGDAAAAGECGAGTPASSSSWHGTHVAGTIAAVTNNASGVAGVAYGAKVVPVRVLGKCGGYTSDIADAIVWSSGGTVTGVPANAYPAKVLNLSLGGGGSCDTTTQNAINSARSRGSVVVVAAGNSNADAANFSPASCTGVISVAAVNRSGGRAYYSNYGSVVDVAAPGGDMRTNSADGILSTLNSGSGAPGADVLAYYQGTSMASPHVAGVVALMLAANPALTPDEVESRLKTSTRAFPATCSQCGTGLVDANAAVTAATGGGGGGGGTVVAEVESNNTRSTAQLISANPATVQGRIASTTDTDYYRVSLAAGKTLTSTLTPPTTADYDLYIYNASGTQIASSTNGTGAVDKATVVNSGTSAATVYVRVRYYGGGVGNYTLGLSQ